MTRLLLMFAISIVMLQQQGHEHPVPEKLGAVSFPTSCKPEVQRDFNRAVALLHSFAYHPAEEAFHLVAEQDPSCAMAHWGSAMTHFHQLWDLPPAPADFAAAQRELRQVGGLDQASERERGLLRAIGLVFQDAATVSYSERALKYEAAMHQLATTYPKDVEIEVFYALALLSNASPNDREHQRQKDAANLLEPLFRTYPDHPGIAHYLIHACDNQEMAQRGLAAARVYADVAPSAPHALHMPSHIFTRLGLWNDSIQSNLAARSAAHQQGDAGEELHAMDYLVYADLQSDRQQDAADLVQQLKAMQNLNMHEFKTGYAATAIPVRYIVERDEWKDAEGISNPVDAPLPVVAIAVWARGLGLARNGHAKDSEKESATLGQIAAQLRQAGNQYWATQVDIMRREVEAWSAQSLLRTQSAIELLSGAAHDEDAIEKLPLTPGPILPAREQLGELLLEQHNFSAAARAFETAAANAPGRRRGRIGAAQAAQLHGSF